MGTSMNDIASKLGVTKAALYKHYKSKQEILDSIIEKMNELDIERVKQYEMPEGDLEKVTAEYKETAFDKIKQFTKVQFLHWTEEEFSSCFRKMLTLEQYRGATDGTAISELSCKQINLYGSFVFRNAGR